MWFRRQRRRRVPGAAGLAEPTALADGLTAAPDAVSPEETQRRRWPQRPSGGRLAAAAGSVTALIIATLIGGSLTFWHQAACRAGAWNSSAQAAHAGCYSDVYTLYFHLGLVDGKIPYLDRPAGYPVLIGAVMQASAWAVHSVAGPLAQGRAFYDVTTAVLVLCAIAGVLATAYLAGRSRRWTALLVALSPGLILTAWVNWHLLAMALTATAMAAWAKRRGVLAGVLFGLAIATLFYPVILLAALLPLCLRTGRLRAFWATTGAAAATWLAVNLPVAIVAFHGWSASYQAPVSGLASYGSIWYYIHEEVWDYNGATEVTLILAPTVVAFALIAWLVLAAPRRPRVPQVLFLALAAYLLLAEVFQPEYVIWLVPLAALARPRLWAWVLWQAAEAGFLFAYSPEVFAEHFGTPGAIPQWLYFTALLARFLTLVLLCALVVRDILRPRADLVRRDGQDDPTGGVLDGTPDKVTLRPPPWPRPARLASDGAR